MVKEPAVLGEEPVAQPIGQCLPREVSLGQQFIQLGGCPLVAIGSREQLAQALWGSRLTSDGGDTDDSVIILVLAQAVIVFLLGPAVAQQPRNGHLKRLDALRRLPREHPLRWVVRARLRYRRIHCLLTPAIDVKSGTFECVASYAETLVELTHRCVKLRRVAEGPESSEVLCRLRDDDYHAMREDFARI